MKDLRVNVQYNFQTNPKYDTQALWLREKECGSHRRVNLINDHVILHHAQVLVDCIWRLPVRCRI